MRNHLMIWLFLFSQELLCSGSHIECEQGASLEILPSSILLTPHCLRKHLGIVELVIPCPFPISYERPMAPEAFTSIRVYAAPCLCGLNFLYIPTFGLKTQSY